MLSKNSNKTQEKIFKQAKKELEPTAAQVEHLRRQWQQKLTLHINSSNMESKKNTSTPWYTKTLEALRRLMASDLAKFGILVVAIPLIAAILIVPLDRNGSPIADSTVGRANLSAPEYESSPVQFDDKTGNVYIPTEPYPTIPPGPPGEEDVYTPEDERLKRTYVDLSFETHQVEKNYLLIQDFVAELGGYVQSSRLWQNDYEGAYLQMKIPFDQVNQFLQRLEQLQISKTSKSVQIYDIQSELTTWQQQEEELQSQLKDGELTELERKRIERQLEQAEQQVERLLEDRLATVNVSLQQTRAWWDLRGHNWSIWLPYPISEIVRNWFYIVLAIVLPGYLVFRGIKFLHNKTTRKD